MLEPLNLCGAAPLIPRVMLLASAIQQQTGGAEQALHGGEVTERSAPCLSHEGGAVLKLRVAGRARKRDDIPDVLQARDVSEGPLEPQAKAGMRYGAVATQIAVPSIRL